MMQLSNEDGAPSSATEMAIGSMLRTSSRAPRLPVMHTFEPPSIILLHGDVSLRSWTEEVVLPWRPQMHSAHTTWVTLSVMDDIGESSARRNVSTWSERRLKATGREVDGWEYSLSKKSGGKVGGGSLGGGGGTGIGTPRTGGGPLSGRSPSGSGATWVQRAEIGSFVALVASRHEAIRRTMMALRL
jgi:hypothetical protein